MEFILIFLIIIGVIFIGLIGVGLLILKRIQDKTKVRFNIILKGNGIYKKKIRKNKLSKKVTILSGIYNFDEKCLIKNRLVDDIFFYENNPDPINFNNENKTPSTYNSTDLKNLMDSDLIEKLFNEKKIEQIELLMFIVVGVSILTLIGVGISFIVPTSITNGANEEMIARIVKNILTGG